MARWKLTEKHYLYTDPPTEWEHVETDLASGEQVRNKYVVPKFLNPEEPKHLNKDGELIVCLRGKGERGDVIIASGQSPTPAMAPLDEEAQAISDSVRRGEHPIEGLSIETNLPPNQASQMQAQINALMMANDELMRRLNAMTQASEAGLDADLAAHTAQQPKAAKPQPGRRV